MAFIFKRLALFMSIAAAFAADKDAAPFRPAPAASFAHHQTVDAVTMGAEAYVSGEKVKTAFGKLDPYENGILPVLVVNQNDGKETIRLDRLKVEYIGPGHERIEATPARELKYLRSVGRPPLVPGPAGKVKIIKPKKNPLDAWEIEGRGFEAKMLPPGQSASGFFYFQTGLRAESTIYISGLTEAGSG